MDYYKSCLILLLINNLALFCYLLMIEHPKKLVNICIFICFCSSEKIPSALDALQEAIKTWQDRTCIRFVHKEESDEFFVTFLRSAG